MIFEVMSERDAVAFSCEQDILPCVIISITNPDDGKVEFAENPQIKEILHLSFYDSEEELYGSVSTADTDKIVELVQAWQDKVEQVVVHCAEGVSRSAGVCAALMRWMQGDDSEIWNSNAYRPNLRCYLFTLFSVNKLRTARGESPVYGRTYKGIFWFKSELEIFPLRIPCDKDGNLPLNYRLNPAALSKSGDNYNHQRAWEQLPRYMTGGNEYNYYPRGRVEIKDGVATVYLNPSLAKNETLEIICKTFILYNMCGITEVRVVADE